MAVGDRTVISSGVQPSRRSTADWPEIKSALRHGKRGENAVAASDRNQFAVRINARKAADIRIDRARFRDIHRRAHRADFDQTQDGMGVDQPGINMFARRVDDLRTLRNRDLRADRGNLPVIKNDRSRRDVGPADRMNRCTFQRDRLRLRRRRNDIGSVHGRDEASSCQQDL